MLLLRSAGEKAASALTVPVCSRTVEVTASRLAKAAAAAFRHGGKVVSAGSGRVSGQKRAGHAHQGFAAPFGAWKRRARCGGHNGYRSVSLKKFHILCIRCDRIGDMLVSTPVIHRLRELYPDAVLDVIASPLGAVALEDNPDVSRLFIYDKKSAASWLRLLPHLLEPHDLVVNFNAHSRTLCLLSALARGRKRAP